MLSVSIVTYQIERHEFSAMLDSLNKAVQKLNQLYASTVQITVIDNGMQQALLQEIISEAQGLTCNLISGQGNIGYGRANNLAIKKSQARYHLILNPDVVLDEDCLVAGINYLRAAEGSKTKTISAISPRVTDENGDVQYLCRRYPSALNFLLRGFAPSVVKKFFRKRLEYYELRDRIKPDSIEVIENVPSISGCFMLCNTEALQKVGGFDERYFLHFEDLALSMELKKIGDLNYVPTMKIQHFGGNSARRGLKHILIFIRSGIKFFNHYGWKLI